jgi:hypothetical protein
VRVRFAPVCVRDRVMMGKVRVRVGVGAPVRLVGRVRKRNKSFASLKNSHAVILFLTLCNPDST